MLSDRERQALLEIEIEFLIEDPSLAVAFARHRVGGPGVRTRLAYDVVAVLAAGACVLCLALSDTGGAEGGVIAGVFAAVTWGVRTWRCPAV